MEHTTSPTSGHERHPLVLLITSIFWAFLWLLSCAKSLIAFATITLPKFIYAILSYSLTFTLNFWSFVVIFVFSAVALNYWIRFRYLETYTTLKEPPLTKPNPQELHPDVNTTEDPLTFHNYLDEFLQAVRVFGFLEKPVFHELARHLQTRRLIAGDTLSLDQDKSFYCVVDGMVEVYTRSPHTVRDGAHWEDDDLNGYQLLNEVGSGGTLSSLFTILSLFTEDVKMSWNEEKTVERTSCSSESGLPENEARPTRTRRADSDVSQFRLDIDPMSRHGRRPSVSSSSSTVHPTENSFHGRPSSPDVDSETTSRANSRSRSSHPPADPPTHSASHSTVARATEDSTLAVIPAEAFRRVTKKFPKSSAHIVQVILTRFSRVTFDAAHTYLGLTTEVLRTEKAINDIACQPLPSAFYEGGGVEHLRQRFEPRGDGTPRSEVDYFSYPSSNGSIRTSNAPVNQNRILSSDTLTESPNGVKSSPVFAFPKHTSRNLVQAGDLLTSAGHTGAAYRLSRVGSSTQASLLSEAFGRIPLSPHGQRLPTEDFDLRDEVMSCMAKSIGLIQPPTSGTPSTEASPAFPATEGSSRAGQASTMLSGGLGSLGSFGSLTLLDTGDQMSTATGDSSSAAGFADMSGLDNEVEILFFAAGSTLVKAGERNSGLYYVIDGYLDVFLPQKSQTHTAERQASSEPAAAVSAVPSADVRRTSVDETFSSVGSNSYPSRPARKASGSKTGSTKPLFTVKRGGIAGYLACLCGNASYVDIKAKIDTYVGFLPSHALDRLLEKRPIVLLTLAKRLISLLSPLVLHIDASLDWVHVNAGQVLWRPAEESDCFYIVINGRLRAISENATGGVSILAEYGQGDTVGELDVITSSLRRSTLHAIRDTELVRMPRTLFNAISVRNPQTTTRLLHMIASRVRDEVDSTTVSKTRVSELGRNNLNLKTIAILPVARHVPVEAFARKLQAALESIGAPTSYLNQASVSSQIGRHAFTRVGKLKVAGWLAEQEQRYRIVLYVANSAVGSSWTQTCIRQADCVMVVGMGEDPSLGEYERLLLSMKTTARKELVLLHPDRYVIPGSTREWLKNRPWIHQHIHVELPGITPSVAKITPSVQDPAAVVAFKTFKDKVQNEIQKYRRPPVTAQRHRPPHSNDFARLARRLCGRSVGLVLGGGGARGMAHLGLIRALEENGIPIDHVGGTSIGAFVGGLYAKEANFISTAGLAKKFSGRMGNMWRILSDVTYPLVAYTTGHEFNRAIYKAFYDLHIEDMWLPYFCNTTNLNTSHMDIHDRGYAWRYIRASMTLAGLLPPLCDNGNMLVDGGYIDNLPVSSMFAMGASAVFAADVGSLDDNSPRDFGDSVSGWWILANRWNPFARPNNIPAIPEIQSRLAYVSSVKGLEEAKVARGSLYMQMPVQDYGTMQFGKFEEIQEVGYNAAIQMIAQFERDGKLPSVHLLDTPRTGRRKGLSIRRNSI